MRFVIVNSRNGMPYVFQDEETGVQTTLLSEGTTRRQANQFAEELGYFEAMTIKEYKEYRWNVWNKRSNVKG